MLIFLKDNNKWVKSQAFLRLGQFIETLRDCKKPNYGLLYEYCRVNSNDVKECFVEEIEIIRVCAFNFPAVV